MTDAWQPYAVHIQTGYHACTANEPVNHSGGDTAVNSTRFGLGALEPCTAITLRMYAERHGWAIGRIQVQFQLVLRAGIRRRR